MKDNIVFLQHILESIAAIEGYVKGVSKKNFLSSLQLQDAILRRLEVIGEAAKNLPSSFKEKHQNLPWRKIEGMRNFIIHEYFGVDLELVWNTIKKDIPVLKQKASAILADESRA
jgi:uncharacterized protein with HEPN domain